MRTLGAIFAGGAGRRFGSDKALALLDGRPLLAHVADRLGSQCAAVVVIGRDWPGLPGVADRPAPGLGPLGGLAGALCHARDHGFDRVLTSGCDLPDLPRDLAVRLGDAPAVVAGQPLLGLWGATLADRAVAWATTSSDRSMRAWIAETDARRVTLDTEIANINRVEDLEALERAHCATNLSPPGPNAGLM
ncbi:molybdenum cofactor guanylyltransferase [Sphingomonas montana]|uniref:molybdenum cofactor guanylyltransferase n=1 Tax=Sphingomonas montana TaxID=1843236 RepID=UPI00096DDE66|nr:molybdenum cofactor guanylyltransferase [Sphingomonas montana]